MYCNKDMYDKTQHAIASLYDDEGMLTMYDDDEEETLENIVMNETPAIYYEEKLLHAKQKVYDTHPHVIYDGMDDVVMYDKHAIFGGEAKDDVCGNDDTPEEQQHSTHDKRSMKSSFQFLKGLFIKEKRRKSLVADEPISDLLPPSLVAVPLHRSDSLSSQDFAKAVGIQILLEDEDYDESTTFAYTQNSRDRSLSAASNQNSFVSSTITSFSQLSIRSDSAVQGIHRRRNSVLDIEWSPLSRSLSKSEEVALETVEMRGRFTITSRKNLPLKGRRFSLASSATMEKLDLKQLKQLEKEHCKISVVGGTEDGLKIPTFLDA